MKKGDKVIYKRWEPDLSGKAFRLFNAEILDVYLGEGKKEMSIKYFDLGEEVVEHWIPLDSPNIRRIAQAEPEPAKIKALTIAEVEFFLKENFPKNIVLQYKVEEKENPDLMDHLIVETEFFSGVWIDTLQKLETYFEGKVRFYISANDSFLNFHFYILPSKRKPGGA